MADPRTGQQRRYQLSAAGAGTDALPRWFERARVRPLSAEELLAAIRTATGFDAAGTKAAKATADAIYFLRLFRSSRPTAAATSRAVWRNTCSSTTATRFAA